MAEVGVIFGVVSSSVPTVTQAREMRSDTKIRNARPGDKPSRLYDERGLYLEISPGGDVGGA